MNIKNVLSTLVNQTEATKCQQEEPLKQLADEEQLRKTRPTLIDNTTEDRDNTGRAYGGTAQCIHAVNTVGDQVGNNTPPELTEFTGDNIFDRYSRIIRRAIRRRTTLRDFKERGFINFRGQRISSPVDAAEIFSIYRYPLKKMIIPIRDKEDSGYSPKPLTEWQIKIETYFLEEKLEKAGIRDLTDPIVLYGDETLEERHLMDLRASVSSRLPEQEPIILQMPQPSTQTTDLP